MQHLKDWQTFDDGNGDNGIEGRYTIEAGNLYIYLEPTNCRGDWVRDVMGWLFPIIRRSGIYHRYWYKNALYVIAEMDRLDLTEDINEIHLSGYSKGGGEASIIDRIGNVTSLTGISAPCGFIGTAEGVNISRKNELVQHFGRWKERRRLPAVSRLFWKNHIYTIDQINEILQGVYNG